MVFQLRTCVACSAGNSSCTHDRAARGVQPERSVRLNDVRVRTHPVGLAAAAGEVPFAADAIAAGDGDRLACVGRTPGDDGTGIVEDRMHRFGIEERRDQRHAVADEQVPAERAIVPADFLEGAEIHPGFDLVAVHRARQEHAAQAGCVQFAEQGLGNFLGAFDLVRGGGDGGGQITRPRDRVRPGEDIHRTFRAMMQGLPNGRCAMSTRGAVAVCQDRGWSCGSAAPRQRF